MYHVSFNPQIWFIALCDPLYFFFDKVIAHRFELVDITTFMMSTLCERDR